MSPSKSWSVALTLTAALTLLSVSYRFLREELAVDRCLSSLHGSFDYSTMSCDLKENHPYVPYRARHPHDKQVLELALATVAVTLLIHGWTKVRGTRVGTE
jgi:hypothetical protein